jgi:hypothetical protein
MILLPRGIPVKENINSGKVNFPESLKKLQKAGFTGYLRFDAPRGGGIILFDTGRILDVSCQAGRGLQSADEVLANLFEQSMERGAVLNIYRISSALAVKIHAILNGPLRYKEQEVKLIDFRALLGKLKEEKFTGGILVYADKRAALIFYRDGDPLGFFNDGSADIETTVDLSTSVARLPGARINILSAASGENENFSHFFETTDLSGLWTMARSRVARRMEMRQEELARQKEARKREHRQKVLALLKEVAARHLGKMGPALAEKEFEKALGTEENVSEEIVEEFCGSIARTAKLVAGPSAVSAMLEEMKRGVGALN